MNRTLRTALVAVVAGGLVAAAAVTGTGSAEASTTATVTPSTIRSTSAGSVFQGGLFVQPDSQPAQAAATLASEGQSSEAAAAATIAKRPIAIWLGEWFQGSLLDSVLARYLAEAEATGTTPVFVTYAIPNRDCGGYSAGGLSASQYVAWNQQIANDLSGHRAVVLVEPDALSETCSNDTTSRTALIKQAVEMYKAASVPTYLDGGNEAWNTPAEQAARLNAAGIADARGFFTNVSNFYGVDGERSYAGKVSALTGNSHFVIDVSRDGQGWKGTWCNPTGAAVGQDPHVASGSGLLDALLWVKTPGASDGTCNGGPSAGSWYASYAVDLLADR
jgi:endoglucanase